jgi:surface polysaccharide O-acyltransferase-like enzyme
VGFVDAWLKLERWVAGPAWFLWVLAVFGGLAAVLHAAAPRALETLGRLGGWCRERPARLAAVWCAAALIAYVPLTLVVNPMAWGGWGPFFVQTSRVLLYAVYFFLGVGLGLRAGLTQDLLAPEGALARRWAWWQAAAGAVFVGFVAVVIVVAIQGSKGVLSLPWALAASALLAVSGVFTSLGLLAYAARRRSVESPVWASLRRNAFGIYLVHYAIVTWLQFAALSLPLPGLVKALLVTVTAIGLSWIVAAGLRRLPGVRRVL